MSTCLLKCTQIFDTLQREIGHILLKTKVVPTTGEESLIRTSFLFFNCLHFVLKIVTYFGWLSDTLVGLPCLLINVNAHSQSRSPSSTGFHRHLERPKTRTGRDRNEVLSVVSGEVTSPLGPSVSPTYL